MLDYIFLNYELLIFFVEIQSNLIKPLYESTRVSNELGAGKVIEAKHAMGVTVKLSIAFIAPVLVFIGFGHNIWAGFFSGDSTVNKAYASMTPLLCISIFLDFIQGILSGPIST